MIPTIAPVKNATYNEIIMLGKPKNKPKRNTNFMSPPPMLSFLSSTENPTEMITKNKNVATPEIRLTIEASGLTNNK